jgi:molecular chaperone HtpG
MTQHTFQAETARLLHLVVHSLYSDREVFLRELLANAADACDKLRVAALTEHGLLPAGETLGVEVEADKDQGTLTIRDTGIGMTEAEAIANLGTIARSGTKAFLEGLAEEQRKGSGLIGQFGVGFYAAFMVADKVVVESRSARAGSDQAVRWESAGDGGFATEPIARTARGTTVTLHLKDDAKEFLEPSRIRFLVKKHADYMGVAIKVKNDKGEWEQANAGTALWTRPKDQITDEQYEEFYRSFHLWDKPATRLHTTVEGSLSFTALLFVPSERPMDLFDRDRRGLSLYVRRVFVMEDCKDLLPEWLRFVRGVVDSDDLPLNVSREMLQGNETVAKLRRQLTKRVVDHLVALGRSEDEKDKTAFAAIEGSFGPILREALVNDQDHKDKVARIVRWPSSWTTAPAAEGESPRPAVTGLEDYGRRNQNDDKKIYVLTAPSLEVAKASPLIEGYVKASKEVLFFVDPVDEWVAQHFRQFDGRELVNISLGASGLDESAIADKAKGMEGFLGFAKDAAGVSEVRLSARLADSPCCVVGDQWSLTPQMEELLRRSGQPVPEQKRILELNPDHPLVQKLSGLYGDEGKRDQVKDWLGVLRDSALLAAGAKPVDGAGLAKRVQALLAQAV